MKNNIKHNNATWYMRSAKAKGVIAIDACIIIAAAAQVAIDAISFADAFDIINKMIKYRNEPNVKRNK